MALACFTACGKPSTESAPSSGSGSAVVPEPKHVPVDIVLRRFESAQTPLANAMHVVAYGGELHVLSSGRIGDVTIRQQLEIDAAGRIRTLPSSRRTTIDEIVRDVNGDGVLVIADAAAPAKDLLPLAAALQDKCWALAVARHDRYLAGLWPVPCPAPRVTDQPELALMIEPNRSTVAITRGGEVTTIEGGLRELGDKLRELRQSPALVDRLDLVFAMHDGATVGEVVDVIAISQAQSFVNPRWVPRDRLPK